MPGEQRVAVSPGGVMQVVLRREGQGRVVIESRENLPDTPKVRKYHLRSNCLLCTRGRKIDQPDYGMGEAAPVEYRLDPRGLCNWISDRTVTLHVNRAEQPMFTALSDILRPFVVALYRRRVTERLWRADIAQPSITKIRIPAFGNPEMVVRVKDFDEIALRNRSSASPVRTVAVGVHQQRHMVVLAITINLEGHVDLRIEAARAELLVIVANVESESIGSRGQRFVRAGEVADPTIRIGCCRTEHQPIILELLLQSDDNLSGGLAECGVKDVRTDLGHVASPASGRCAQSTDRKPDCVHAQRSTTRYGRNRANLTDGSRIKTHWGMMGHRLHSGEPMPTALITGASSGMGREFARIHARRDRNAIIVARRGEALQALKKSLESEFNCEITAVEADLATADGIARVADVCAPREIGVLINNAGFGDRVAFCDQKLDKALSMIDLNIRALTEIVHAVAPAMVARGTGRILNVGSTAGFLPGPMQAVYYASKAYVNSFSQALAEELDGTGVTVTLLAPGPVKTEFADTADMSGLAMMKHAAEAATVARAGYEAMMRGELVCINDRRLSAMSRILGLVPRRTLLKMSKRSMTERRDENRRTTVDG